MPRIKLLVTSAIPIIAAGLTCAVAPTAAHAQQTIVPVVPQDPTGADASQLDEIVVTAQRRGESLQDVPISVAVATGETMRQAQVTNLNDLGNRLSGVKVSKAGASDSLNIRGIGSGFNMGFEQSVATFVDGVYIPRSQATRVGFLDLERIEVLKGPQSTYFGSNAIAGALSATTRKPSQTPDGYASILYAPDDGEFDVQGAYGGPLTERLSARAALRYSGMDGYIENVRRDEMGPHNADLQARIALRYEDPEALDVSWNVDYANFDDTNSELQEILNCPPAPGYGNPGVGCLSVIASGGQDNRLDYRTTTGDSSFALESVSSTLTVQRRLAHHTLTSTTGVYDHDIRRFTDSPLLAVGGLSGITRSSGLPIDQHESFKSFSQELRLESEKGGFLEYVLGAYYDRSELQGELNFGFYFAPFAARLGGLVPATTPIAQQVTGDQDQSNRSIFGAATLNLTDRLRVNLGARYSSVHKENHRTTRVGTGNALGNIIAGGDFSPAATAAWTATVGFPAGDYPITRRTDDKFMPSINAQYDLTSDVMVYASYATGFKAGGWAIGNSRDVFGPESVKSYEAGLKASWLDRRLTTNIAVFDSRYEDLQESTTVVNAAGIIQSVIANVGEARVRGVDLDIRYRPFTGFTVAANIGYLDAEYVVYPNAPCTQLQILASPVGCTQNLAGKTKAYAPDWSGGVNASYEFGLTPGLDAKLGAWVYFSSGYYQQASIDPLFYQADYAKLDLRAAISDPNARWELSIIAKNVTDEVTASYRSVMTASNAVTASPDRPRSIAIQLSTKF